MLNHIPLTNLGAQALQARQEAQAAIPDLAIPDANPQEDAFLDGVGDYDRDVGGFETASNEEDNIPPQDQPEGEMDNAGAVAAAFGMEEMAAVLEEIVAGAEEDRAAPAEVEEDFEWDQARAWEDEQAAAEEDPEDLVMQAVEEEQMEELEGIIADNGTLHSFKSNYTYFEPS